MDEVGEESSVNQPSVTDNVIDVVNVNVADVGDSGVEGAEVGEETQNQLSATHHVFNINVNVPDGDSQARARARARENQWQAILKTGLFISSVSAGGVFVYPLTTATEGKSGHGFTSQILFVSLAIGVLLMLLSALLYRNPRLINIANSLTQLGTY